MMDENLAAMTRRRYMAGLGLSVALISVAGMILSKSLPEPWWLSAAANALVILVGFYPLRYLEEPSANSARPALSAVIVAGLVSSAGWAVVILLLGNDIPAYLIAGGVVLGIWSSSAWWAGRA